jgi:hypothetical protein
MKIKTIGRVTSYGSKIEGLKIQAFVFVTLNILTMKTIDMHWRINFRFTRIRERVKYNPKTEHVRAFIGLNALRDSFRMTGIPVRVTRAD